MAEKRLSGEEQRAKMKEEFKKDLRMRKQFLQDVKEHQRQKTLTDAVVNITSALENDDTDVWVEQVNQKTALSEAKMEMALDSMATESSSLPSEKERLAMSDAEIRKIKAQELVNQMKAEMMGTTTQQETSAPVQQPAPETPAKQEPPVVDDQRPPRNMLDGI